MVRGLVEVEIKYFWFDVKSYVYKIKRACVLDGVSYGIGGNSFLYCHVTSRDHMIKGTCLVIRKIGNTGRIDDTFAWTWNFWGDRTRNTSKQWEMAAFSEEFLSEKDVEAVLATFCCYDYGANAYETVEKIVTD